MHFFLLYTIILLIYYHFHVIMHERIRVQLTLGPIEVCDHPETHAETPCLSLIVIGARIGVQIGRL